MPDRPSKRPLVTSIAITAILVIGLVIFARVVRAHYPISEWLVWRYIGYWIGCLAFSLASLGLGHATIKAALRGRSLPLYEHTICGLCIGMLLFEFAVFGVGLLHAYGTAFFFSLPLVLIAATIVPTWRHYRPAIGRLRRHHARLRRRPWWHIAIVGLGTLGLGMVYVSILTPENVQFDARWKHLALAEDFIAAGGVHRFEEGWIFATRAHFTSYLYTWAFAHPSGVLFDQIELSQHMEFTVFCWTTLIGIPVLVRRLVPGADPALVWAARFLFPGVFLYDSSLTGGADHVVAAFCVPAYLLLRRSWRRLDSGILILLAAIIAGMIMGKETMTVMVLPAIFAVLAVRWTQLTWATIRKRLSASLAGVWWRAPAVMMVAAALWGAPHWLCNLVWYGDPFYPVLHEYFTPKPWLEDSAYTYKYAYVEYQMWRPDRSIKGVLETLEALATFSFIPNDWKNFHGKVPVFGSLMTLLLPTLLLLRRTKPVWWLAAWVHAAIFGWYWVHHQDRYLQAILPWMAALVAALLVMLWRVRARLVQVAVVGLVSFQVLWGGDVYFIQTHSMIRSPLKAVADLLAAGYKKEYDARLRTQGTYAKIGDLLPEGAHVLMHENHAHLGIGATSVADWSTWQYGMDYSLASSPREVYEQLHALGITHLSWTTGKSRSWDSLASDIMFFTFAVRHSVEQKRVAKTTLARMPDAPPPESSFPDVVAVLGCGRQERAGLYRVADLRTPMFGPRERDYPTPYQAASTKDGKKDAESLIAGADYVVVDPKCHAGLMKSVKAKFQLLALRRKIPSKSNPGYEIYMRTATAAPKPQVADDAADGEDDDEVEEGAAPGEVP